MRSVLQSRPPGRHRRPAPPRTHSALGRRGATLLTATAVVLPLSAVAATGAWAAATPAPTQCASIGIGAQGPAVKSIQALVGTTADGAYGPATAAAVKVWQQKHRLPATGTFDAATWAGLPVATGAVDCGVQVTFPKGSTPTCTTLVRNSTGAAVNVLQRRLGIAPASVYGPLTQTTVTAFQKAHKIAATGTVDHTTWAALGLTGTAACGTIPAPATPIKTASTTPAVPIKTTATVATPPAPAPVSASAAAQQKVATQVASAVAALATRSDQASPVPAAVAFAQKQLGRPYLYGGTTPAGYDCSGLMLASYAAAGLNISRTAAQQYAGGQNVALSDLRPGDIVFYATNLLDPSTTYHDAMYVGHGQMIEAAHSGTPVRLTPLRATGLLPLAARPSGMLTLPATQGTNSFTARTVQTRLVAHGQPVSIDGAYGPLTAAAVAAVQRAARLPATGIVDAATWAVLAS
jgi:cell wall-associated NlpC family hydrolase